jgi:diguanylate cyclase (GGDEF)-like protein
VELLELKHTKADNLISRINQVSNKLKQTITKISIFNQDKNVSQKYLQLQEIWQELLGSIQKYRKGPTESLTDRIMNLSEGCEILIDSLFSEAEIVLDKNERNLIIMIIVFIAINGSLIILIGFIVKKYISEKLEYMASHDQLTSLPNRFIYREILGKEIAQAFRTSSKLSLILFDIDFFKHINDKYGHNAGDEVLRFIAKTINTCIRKSDFLFRIGGEEFAIIAGNTNIKQASLLSEKIRNTVMHLKNTKYGTITLSFGLAELEKEDNAELLFKKADTVLYRAKKRGRNRVEVYNKKSRHC